MKDRKTIILIVVISILVIYHVFSRSSSMKEIKSLTDKIETNIDSLRVVQSRYDSLEKDYSRIYDQLNLTRNGLTNFKKDVDSVMHANIRNVNKINESLSDIIEKQDSFESIHIDTTSFRFN